MRMLLVQFGGTGSWKETEILVGEERKIRVSDGMGWVTPFSISPRPSGRPYREGQGERSSKG